VGGGGDGLNIKIGKSKTKKNVWRKKGRGAQNVE
jgi:hypothetical protein